MQKAGPLAAPQKVTAAREEYRRELKRHRCPEPPIIHSAVIIEYLLCTKPILSAEATAVNKAKIPPLVDHTF